MRSASRRWFRELLENIRSSPEHQIQVGLLAVGAIYCLVTFLMWSAMRDQLKIAQGQLDTARKAYESGERAWLGPAAEAGERKFQLLDADYEVIGTALDKLTDGRVVRVRVFVTNSGKTPAVNVWYRTAVVYANKIPEPENSQLPSTAVFPNATTDFVSTKSEPLRVTNAKTDANANHENPPGLFIAATICYDDIFGKRHFTKTCRVIGPNQPNDFGECAMDTVDTSETSPEEILKTCPK